jgi:hypothetical protein
MTEAEWFAATNVTPILRIGTTKCSPRKLRLFMAGWQRLRWEEITVPAAREAVALAERFADGAVSKKEVERAYDDLRAAPHGSGSGTLAMIWPTSAQMPAAVYQFLRQATPPEPSGWDGEKIRERYRALTASQAALFRDIVGNPFRPITFSSSWRTDTAILLARQMYKERDFSAMPILADALQDAGCDNPDILDHCRDANQIHVRGCWVVDLVLGKA